MNELQKVEFDLFRCFIKICDQLDLPYFVVCGSAIGAARHGGFIPWDDDMDVGLYRDDYNKFMEKASEYLPEGIFLQNYKTDPNFPAPFAKLRNSKTTYIEKATVELKINHGIYIDIFPLDGYPKDVSEQKRFAFWKKFYALKLFCVYPQTTVRRRIVTALFRVFGYHKRTAKTAAKYEKLLSKYPVKDSDIICNHGTWKGNRDYLKADRYGKGTYLMFEGIKVRVPEKYDEYLSDIYGDWRNVPPPDKQIGHHYYEICDTKRPYTEYIEIDSKGQVKIIEPNKGCV